MKKSIFILGITSSALLLTSFLPIRQSTPTYYDNSNPQYHDSYYQDSGYYEGGYRQGSPQRQGGYYSNDGRQQQGYYYQQDGQRGQGGYYRSNDQWGQNQQQQRGQGGYYSQDDQWNQNQQQQRAQGGYYSSDDQNQGNVASADQEIAEQINSQIKPGFISRGYQGVSFDVRNGNVILRGSVESQEDKEKLENKIRSIKGVRNLDSQLIVNKQAATLNEQNRSFERTDRTADRTVVAGSDDEISKKIHDLIKPGYLSKGYEGVQFNVRNGNVWLKGSIDSQKDKEKLENNVRSIKGVKNVDSQIAIINHKE